MPNEQILQIDYNKIANPYFKESTFGERLRMSRINLGMTMEEVASLCCVTKSIINGYELNRFYPSIETLKLLSKKFDLIYLCKDGYTKILLNYNKFIENLNDWIYQNNFTHQEAADKLGISRTLLRFWINGSVIRSSTYYKIVHNLEKYNLI